MQRFRASRRARKRGQVMFMFALMVPLLLGFLGLTLDVGRFFHVKRRMQTAADAGAVGGANELWRRNLDKIESAAKLDSRLNGFDDARADITVTVNNPPLTGARAGNNQFVEVIVSQPVDTFFLRFFNSTDVNIQARGVAGLVAFADGCVIALDPDDRGALTVAGGAVLTSGCGVMVNSDNGQALETNGGGCIYATQGSFVGVTGSYVMNGTSNCVYPPPRADTPPIIDPLAYMTEPVVTVEMAQFNNQVYTSNDQNSTSEPFVPLGPGVYRGGIHISGANVNFAAGLYILEGGDFQISGNSIVNGTGVTFYLSQSSAGQGQGQGQPLQCGIATIAGGVTANLSAPTTGDYAGVLIWRDNGCSNNGPESTITGTEQSQMIGALYFPASPLNYAGTSETGGWTMIVANTIDIVGTSNVGNDYAGSNVPVPTRKVTLVE